jgi:hypothetical protein
MRSLQAKLQASYTRKMQESVEDQGFFIILGWVLSLQHHASIELHPAKGEN